MPKYESQELKVKQAELFVSQQIMAASNQARKQDSYIDALPMSSPSDINPTLRDFTYQDFGLKRLVEKGLIRILNAKEPLRIGIHIRIMNMTRFQEFYTELFESIPSVGSMARIVYSTTTGKGKVNGVEFRFKGYSRNRRVFEYLVQNPNKRISKPKLWSASGKKREYNESTDGVIEFNDIITNLRDALKGISATDLYLKKVVILKAEVTLL